MVHRIWRFEDTEGEKLQESEEYWRTGDLCYLEAESFTTLGLKLHGKQKNVANKLANLEAKC